MSFDQFITIVNRTWVFPADTQRPQTLRETSDLTPEIYDYVRRGGCALLIQHREQPLPTIRCPFWREGIKLMGSHPVMDVFPHDGYADLQFYGIATDFAFESNQLGRALPDLHNIQYLMRRLDARQFTLAEYLLMGQLGEGLLIATTLRLSGGLGDQPQRLQDNPTGNWLLNALDKYAAGWISRVRSG